jgi:hypothetical protein
MTRWRWAFLIFELFLIALILVLPQVDLPDFTFHSGTAPVAAKARLSSASTGAGVTITPARVSLPSHLLEIQVDAGTLPASSGAKILLALLCTFLC